MPKSKEISFGKYFNLPNPGLRSYFDIVRSGQPEVYETPFAKSQNLDELLDEWDKTLVSIKSKWPTLYEFEEDMGSKAGPMSVMKPLKERMGDIDHYYDDILLSSSPVSEKAIKATISEFKLSKGLKQRSERQTLEVMKKSTNSGSPYFTKRRVVVNKTSPSTLQTADNGTDVIQKLPSGDWLCAAVLGWRGQEGGPKPSDVKQRVVWMFPFAVNLHELQVYQPLIESFQKFGYVPAWVSMDAVDERITRMFDTKGKEDVVICTDFSKFDQHFNEDMQAAAKSILAGLLAPHHEEICWLETVFPIKYMIPLAYDFGHIRYGKHGMGSGSGGTNADETLAHRALQYEAAINAGQRLNPNSQCLGDDGVLTYPGIAVEDVMRSYTAHGQEMNESKQYVSKHNCIYLRRWHQDDFRDNGVCVGVYSTKRALGRLKEQERYYDPEVWGAKMVALRELSIVENTKWHPLFEPFVDYCMKKDKFRLGLDIPGFLDNIDAIAKEATDLMPDFLGYTKSMNKDSEVGISNWRVVKYLKSKR